MAPWLDYPTSDPRSGRSNWRLDESTGQPVYVGPPIEGMPNDGTGTLYIPTADIPTEGQLYNPDFSSPYVTTNASYDASGYEAGTYGYSPGELNYDAAEPYGGGGMIAPESLEMPPPPPPSMVSQYGAGSGSGGAGALSATQPIGNVGIGYGGGALGGGTIGYGSGQSDFVTPMIPVYDGMLAQGGGAAPGSAAPMPVTGGAVDPVTGAPIASDPYGYDTGYGYAADPGYGYDAGYGQGYATDPMTGLPLFPGDGFGSQPQSSPYGFDPFLWAGVKNPMPAPSAMRGQIMQAGGFAGPAWAPAPPPQPPGPMAYVRARLGMQEPGHTLEMKPPVPGFRFDGTPRSEPREESQNFVPADQVGMLPPLPPTFPRRGY